MITFQYGSTPFQYPSGGSRLTSVFQILQNYGFQDFILPFMLFFALMFAVLQKVGLFQKKDGTADRSINGVISAAIAGLIVVPHVLQMYPAQYDPVQLMYQLLPMSSVAFIVLLLGLMFIGLFVPAKVAKPNVATGAIGLIAAGIVLVTFLTRVAPGLVPPWLWFDQTTVTLAIVIGVMLLIIWFIAGEESNDDFITYFEKVLGGGSAGGGDKKGTAPAGGKPA